MGIATKIVALLTAIRRQDVEELSPAERHRLASLCRYVAALADQPVPPPKRGVYHDLKAGRGFE